MRGGVLVEVEAGMMKWNAELGGWGLMLFVYLCMIAMGMATVLVKAILLLLFK